MLKQKLLIMFKEKIIECFGEDCEFIDELNEILVNAELEDFVVADGCDTRIMQGVNIAGFYDDETQKLYFVKETNNSMPDKPLYILLHELGHHLRNKKGKLTPIEDMIDDEEMTVNDIATSMIREEKIADKFAAINYYRLTGEKLISSLYGNRMDYTYNQNTVERMAGQFLEMGREQYENFKDTVRNAFYVNEEEEETEEFDAG